MSVCCPSFWIRFMDNIEYINASYLRFTIRKWWHMDKLQYWWNNFHAVWRWLSSVCVCVCVSETWNGALEFRQLCVLKCKSVWIYSTENVKQHNIKMFTWNDIFSFFACSDSFLLKNQFDVLKSLFILHHLYSLS